MNTLLKIRDELRVLGSLVKIIIKAFEPTSEGLVKRAARARKIARRKARREGKGK